MEYLAVRCRSCEKEFPVERIGSASEAAPFRRPSFKASYTCPHCYATHDYPSDDLTVSAGSTEAIKDIYIYPLVRDARQRLCGDSTR